MASRYAAVFPLSELINWIFHTRGQRHEELPHSYQMMLFWAGLRGAVGVALAAGITGDNADALRTTILVVVVLTVIVFGGTTARMLEVLGIRVGVEDEDGSSDDEAAGWGAQQSGNLALQMGPGSRRYASANGRHNPYGDDYDDYNNSYISSPVDSPAYNTNGLQLDRHPSQVAPRFGPRRSSAASGFAYGHAQRGTQSGGLGGRSEFFNNPTESDDDEPLPNATDLERFDQGAQELSGESDHTGMVFRDGQWFKDLDQRYLLPLFSNSVASRKHEIRRASRRANSVYNGGDSGPNTPRETSMDWGAREDVIGPDGKQTPKNFR
jgi:sodium/hydrogen exchanger-like protein 6/7